MMKTPTTTATPTRTVRRWLINLIWIVAWIVIYFLCIDVFGNTVAFIGVPTLIVTSAIIWFATERRDRQPPEKAS
ncbi:hypothetical protein [Dictyobacter formicarum]|uniref:Uncharacterized protein n=1 Tax=Dictyobacter formicarum TaxID=2778368 RepID=A0ABQ3VA68_9CHLR|nr:hypothetical protein [Dictyobacter formicarum]GHO82680.1 hypothetical protein KSZ_06860 [Dictyobacter formicarum]